MPEVILPMLDTSTSLNAAIDRLRTVGRGAVITKEQDKVFLLTAGDIVAGRSKGKRFLSDLLGGKLPLTETSPGPVYFIAQVGGKRKAPREPYTVTATKGDAAVLEFNDADLLIKYSAGPKDYYCDGPRHHDDFPPPTVSEGDDCPRGDGYKIVSSS